MKRLRILPLVLLHVLIILIVSACSTTPRGIIPPDQMASLLADIYVGEATIETSGHLFTTDSARRAFRQSIYIKHGVNAVTVDTSLYWYGKHLSEYMKVCEETENILRERISDAERRGATSSLAVKTISLDGDSVNLWKGIPLRRITTSSPSDFITFSVSRDKNWEKGDHFTLRTSGKFTTSPIRMAIVVDYTDGTSEYVSHEGILDTRTDKLTLVLDSAKVGSTVYGYIHYTPADGEISYLDSISLVRTRGMNNNRIIRQGQNKSRYR